MLDENHFQIQVMQNEMVEGKTTGSLIATLGVKANFSITNVKQVGSTIEGDLRLQVEAGLIKLEVTKHFSISTVIGNPVTLDLGYVGPFPIIALFYYDIPGREICAELTIAGLIKLAKKCFKW